MLDQRPSHLHAAGIETLASTITIYGLQENLTDVRLIEESEVILKRHALGNAASIGHTHRTVSRHSEID
jgi:hypothetical protein